MSLRFAAPFAKLDRAEEHLRELHQLPDAHMRRPDLIVGTIGYDPDTKRIYPRYRVQGVPHKALIVAGDVIHNLRSALDHAMWQLVRANGGQPKRKTDFPIYRTRRPVEIDGGVSPTTQRLVEAEQPFNAKPWEQPTTLPLAKLQHISNVDKHRTPIRGHHGIQNLVMTAGPRRTDGGRWEGRIVLGDMEDRGRAISLEPMPGSEGEVGGSAWYQIDVEYAETPVGAEAPYNFDGANIDRARPLHPDARRQAGGNHLARLLGFRWAGARARPIQGLAGTGTRTHVLRSSAWV